jgi:sugar/nucleoside kinase (ribokinase family)
MTLESFDVTVVGHLCIDSIILPSRPQPFMVLGGATTYTSFAAKNLDAYTSVISKVGVSFPQAYLWWLEQEGIDISGVTRYPDEATTSFELTYLENFDDRSLKLRSHGAALSVDDIPAGFRSKAIHLGPIANEIPYEVAELLKNCCDLLSLDPQGLTRSFDAEGNVFENAAEVNNDIFSLVNVFKSSQHEIFALTGEKELKPAIRAIHDVGVETVIVTLGSKGSILSVEGAQYNVGACPSNVLVDPTGAGDVFIGGFLAEYLRGKESLWCASVGSAAASMVVESIGPTYFGKKEDIYQRAHVLYEKELKQ